MGRSFDGSVYATADASDGAITAGTFTTAIGAGALRVRAAGGASGARTCDATGGAVAMTIGA